MSTIKELGSTWKTRDGRVVSMVNITIEHLRNTIAYLERRLASEAWRVKDHPCRPDQGEWGVSDCMGCDHEANRKYSWEKKLVQLRSELEKRT
jgi:hypothetical protein